MLNAIAALAPGVSVAANDILLKSSRGAPPIKPSIGDSVHNTRRDMQADGAQERGRAADCPPQTQKASEKDLPPFPSMFEKQLQVVRALMTKSVVDQALEA